MITIKISDPERVSNDLSDLLCWWQGYKMGLNLPQTEQLVADFGISAASQLKKLIDAARREEKRSVPLTAETDPFHPGVTTSPIK